MHCTCKATKPSNGPRQGGYINKKLLPAFILLSPKFDIQLLNFDSLFDWQVRAINLL